VGAHGDRDRRQLAPGARECMAGERSAIVPTIAGQAWITGVFQHGVDPSNPFRAGFTLPDLWF